MENMNEILNLLRNETKNIDDSEMISFNVSFVKDIIEIIEKKDDVIISLDADVTCKAVEIGRLKEEIDVLNEMIVRMRMVNGNK